MKPISERSAVFSFSIILALTLLGLSVAAGIVRTREYPGRFSIAFEQPAGAGGEVVIMNGSPSRKFSVTVLSGGIELGTAEAIMSPGQPRIYVSAEAIAGTMVFPEDLTVRVADESGNVREIRKMIFSR